MTVINNVSRKLLADLLGNDHDKRIMAERHLLAMLANAPSPAGADAVARITAAPVQQVSVPDGPAKMQWPEIVALVNEVLGCEAHKYPCERGSIGHEMTGINFNSLARIIDRVHRLAAAPAAPAADAGIVDMYRHLQKVTPYRFKKIQDASITDGGDVMYFHKDRFDAALLADMAAHCAAKGVV